MQLIVFHQRLYSSLTRRTNDHIQVSCKYEEYRCLSARDRGKMVSEVELLSLEAVRNPRVGCAITRRKARTSPQPRGSFVLRVPARHRNRRHIGQIFRQHTTCKHVKSCSASIWDFPKYEHNSKRFYCAGAMCTNLRLRPISEISKTPRTAVALFPAFDSKHEHRFSL